MDLYFERHDGQAVTTEDFVQAMSDASGTDLEHFKLWYDQNGTPQVEVELDYDSAAKTCKLTMTQSKLKLNNSSYDSLYMPFHIALYNKEGKKFEIESDGKLILSDKITSITFSHIDELPIPSLNQNFTAPVNTKFSYSKDDLAILMGHDQDEFNRYDAAQTLVDIEIMDLMTQYDQDNTQMKVSKEYLQAFGGLLRNENLSHSFRALALQLPSLKAQNDKLEMFNFDSLPAAIDHLRLEVASHFETDLTSMIYALDQKGDFSITPKAMGERALKGFCLKLLSTTETPAAMDLVFSRYQNASNMTDELDALIALVKVEGPYRSKAIDSFFKKWKDETLVIQKWISCQAASKITTLEDLKVIEALDVYDKKVPNLFRSLMRGFASGNTMGFHHINGSGYKFVADRVIEMDSLNPQIAAGLCKGLNFLKKLDSSRAELLKSELIKIRDNNNASNDVLEVVGKNLG